MNVSDSEKNSVTYIANARLPTERAHGYQVAQMCQAIIESGASLELWHPYRKNNKALSGMSLRDYYGLRLDILQMQLNSIDWHNSIGRCGALGSFGAHYIQSRTFYRSVTKKLKDGKSSGPIYLRDGDLAVWLSKRLPQIRSRMIVELHYLPRRSWRRLQLVNQLKNTRLIVTLTSALKLQLLELGVPEHQIHTAADAVDWETFDVCYSQLEARSKLNLPMDMKIAAYVGKYHTNGEEKGIPEIIRAARIIKNTHPDLRFYFVGGPSSRVSKYRALANKLGVADALFFIDKQPILEVPKWLRAADVLLLPFPLTLLYDKYMSPLKMFEYMSAG